jgi:hypothetical protein
MPLGSVVGGEKTPRWAVGRIDPPWACAYYMSGAELQPLTSHMLHCTWYMFSAKLQPCQGGPQRVHDVQLDGHQRGLPAHLLQV